MTTEGKVREILTKVGLTPDKLRSHAEAIREKLAAGASTIQFKTDQGPVILSAEQVRKLMDLLGETEASEAGRSGVELASCSTGRVVDLTPDGSLAGVDFAEVVRQDNLSNWPES